MEDGYTVKYLPSELLRDLNIVDTPGTNVILERQQRLTEEYVPRADMVLFTMSAGVPCAMSCLPHSLTNRVASVTAPLYGCDSPHASLSQVASLLDILPVLYVHHLAG